MTPDATTKKCTFEEYLRYDDGTDNRYKFVYQQIYFEEKEYQGSDRIVSSTFPKLVLTTEQILQVSFKCPKSNF